MDGNHKGTSVLINGRYQCNKRKGLVFENKKMIMACIANKYDVANNN